MKSQIKESIKHIKNISKREVTTEKHQRKNWNLTIRYEDLNKNLDTMVKNDVLHESESGNQ